MILLAAKNKNNNYDFALACSYGAGAYHEAGYNFTVNQVKNVAKRFNLTPEYVTYEILFEKFGMIDEKKRYKTKK